MKHDGWLTAFVAAAVIGAVVGVASADQKFAADKAHGRIGFSVSHLVISTVKGDFRDYEATLSLDEKGHVSAAEGVIQVASIDTGSEGRDKHLRAEDFFDVKQFPTITFKSKEVKHKRGKTLIVGDFTMHGVTKELTLPATVKGPIKDPWGKTRIGFSATAVVNRKDYGLKWNAVLETGGLAVGEDVTLDINMEAVLAEE